MKYKKIIIIILMILCLTGCGENNGEGAAETTKNAEPSPVLTEKREDLMTEQGTESAPPSESAAQEKETVGPLKEIYEDYFMIGLALNPVTIGDEFRETILTHSNSVTCENEMKPDYVLDHAASLEGVQEDPAFVGVKFDACQELIAFCEENGLKMRFHTLVWHAQTPEWFFHMDYDTEKELADREQMQARMKNYIDRVIQYFDENHPDLIYAIDVVNEAFNGEGTYKIKDTENRWYDTLGYDYLYYAFLYAREALDASRNMQEVTLVYNDYGMMSKVDRVLDGLNGIFGEHGAEAEDYVDAVGFQGHLDIKTSLKKFTNAVKRFGDAGYELQITELDIGIPETAVGSEPKESDLDTQGRKYRYLMEALMKLKDDGYRITGITVWGLSDEHSWRKNTDGMDAHALLWGKKMKEKPALRGMALCEDVKSYFIYGLDY